MNPLAFLAPALAGTMALSPVAAVPVAETVPAPSAPANMCNMELTDQQRGKLGSDVATEIMKLANDYRVKNGKRPLAHSTELATSATSWADQLSTTNTLGTQDNLPGGGYRGQSIQFLSSISSAKDAFDQWITSDKYRNYVLSNSFNVTGVGVSFSKKNCAVFAVQDFAATSNSVTPPTVIPPTPTPLPNPGSLVPRPPVSFSG